MQYTETIYIDINKKLIGRIDAVQYDTKRALDVHILDKGQVFDLTGLTVRYYVVKPDGKFGYKTATVTNAALGQVKIELTNVVTAVPGEVEFQIVILDGEDSLSTIPIPINVIKATRSDQAVLSDNNYDEVLDYIVEQYLASRISDGSIQSTTIADLSITAQKLANGAVTIDKQNFLSVTDGIIDGELYDDVAVSGGFTTTGLDAVSSDYSRTNYLTLPDHACTITITDTSGVLTTPYLFLYTEQGVTGTRITAFTNPSTGVYVFEFTDTSYLYMRMLTKSPTWGDCSATLSIEYKYTIGDEVIINDYDLDTRYNKIDYLGSPSEIVHFTNTINVNFADVDSNTLNVQDTVTELEDNAILFLPPNYSKTGKPVRLVIGCHGMSSTPIGSTTTSLAGAQSFLNSMGYAVLDVNGIPLSLSNNTNYHFGSPLALQSYLKAYKYVIDNYNVTKDVFVYGISMGGLTSNAIVNSGSIPVVAQGNFCPVLDLYKQMYYPSVAQRELFATLHDFDGRESITFTTSQNATQAEIDLYKANLDKFHGLNPMSAKCINWNNSYLDNINDDTEQNNYNSLIRFHNVPLKVWHNQDDTTVQPRYSNYYVDAIKRGGSIAKLRTFPSGGHNAWSNGETINVTDIEGNTVSPHASEYELYLWFKRFE